MDDKKIIIVVTYNIRCCLGTDGICNPRRIVETLQATNAHVIGLQEVKSDANGLNGGGQAQFLAEKLDMEFAIGSDRTRKQETYGTALLSRFPIEGTYNLDITIPGFQPRSCVLATLRGHMGNIIIANTHLGLGRRERNLQAKLIYDLLIKMVRSIDSLIFMGDFNDWGTVSQVHRLFKGSLKLATTGRLGFPLRSYPTYLPLLPLDRIYCGMGFLVTHSFVVKSSIARKASDHYPVVVELRPAVPARVKHLRQTFELKTLAPSVSSLREASKFHP